MTRRARFIGCALPVLMLLTLSACGQMGPLMLPDEEATTEEEEESDEENER